MEFLKCIKLDSICMKMKLMKNEKYLQQKFSRKILVPQTTADFKSRVSKSNAPFTCKFPMVMHFVSILHRRYRSKTNFYFFSYDKTSLKFCASFRYFHTVFMEKFQKNPLSELCENRKLLRSAAEICAGGGRAGVCDFKPKLVCKFEEIGWDMFQ